MKRYCVWMTMMVLIATTTAQAQNPPPTNETKPAAQVTAPATPGPDTKLLEYRMDELSEQQKQIPAAVDQQVDDRWEGLSSGINWLLGILSVAVTLVTVLGSWKYRSEIGVIKKERETATKHLADAAEDREKIAKERKTAEEHTEAMESMRGEMQGMLKQMKQEAQNAKESEKAAEVSSLFAESHDLRIERKYAGAIEKYEAIEAIDPDNYGVYNNWGNILYELGRYADACAKYQKAVKLKPELPEAYNNWGAALMLLGNYAAAREKYKKANEIKDHGADYNLACVEVLDGNIGEGERYLKMANEHGTLPSYEYASKAEALKLVWEEDWFKELNWAKV
jgi:tetratricopeptide (TPR) repeat protein